MQSYVPDGGSKQPMERATAGTFRQWDNYTMNVYCNTDKPGSTWGLCCCTTNSDTGTSYSTCAWSGGSCRPPRGVETFEEILQ